MNTDTKRKELLEVVKELKDNGFRVYSPKDLTTYVYFVKDNNIGYVERGDYGFNLSTVHKPCHECGTGFSIERDIFEPTIKQFNACFVLAPRWASYNDLQYIKKYKNWEDYTKAPVNQIFSYIEL